MCLYVNSDIFGQIMVMLLAIITQAQDPHILSI